MLDQNWQALFMSFTSLIRLFDGFRIMRTEFWALFKAVSLMKLLHSLYNWLRGPRSKLDKNVNQNVTDFLEKKTQRSPLRLILVLGGISLLVGPFLYNKLRQRILRQQEQERKSRQRASRRRNGREPVPELIPVSSTPASKGRLAECIFDVHPRSPRELELFQGDIVMIAARVGHNWLAAETRDGRRGLVPTDAMRPVPTDKQSSSKRRRRRRPRTQDLSSDDSNSRMRSGRAAYDDATEETALRRREEARRRRVDSFDIVSRPERWGDEERFYVSDRDRRNARRSSPLSSDDLEPRDRRPFSDDDRRPWMSKKR